MYVKKDDVDVVGGVVVVDGGFVGVLLLVDLLVVELMCGVMDFGGDVGVDVGVVVENV